MTANTPPIDRTKPIPCAGCGNEKPTFYTHRTTIIPSGWARLVIGIRGVNDPSIIQRRTVYVCSPECGMDALEEDFDRAVERG